MGEQMASSRDRFGNVVDPAVRYARGSILRDSADEYRRMAQGNALIRKRVAEHGPDSIFILTGNLRGFPLRGDDLGVLAEEWVGSALQASRLEELVREHLGAPPDAGVATFNRCSAGIIATVSALAPEGSTLLSFAPSGSGAHSSLRRGCHLARVRILEVGGLAELEAGLERERPSLAVITPVCSELKMLPAGDVVAAAGLCRRMGVLTFVDDAYGARIRPVLFGGPRSLELGVDLAISNADKAGLLGPRGGYMAGKMDLVTRIQARAGELGLEARAPISLGIARSLERWDPEFLREEVRSGAALAEAVEQRIGAHRVVKTVLGPTVGEEDVLELALERARLAPEGLSVVPVEASAALGMILLERYGILTVNVAGQPGARVSIRLKPAGDVLDSFGGAGRMAAALDEGITLLAGAIGDAERIGEILLGRS